MMIKVLLWKYEAVQAERKLRCLQEFCLGCIQCMLREIVED